jgi:KUP system potassium uptake protein
MSAALGVVFGAIGTSPLYTLRVAFGDTGLPLDEQTVMGVLSLVFWALVMVVTIKYIGVVLRADNRGEGGVLALGTLAQRHVTAPLAQSILASLSILGIALFYGDSLITPAISVLSAVEGLQIATPLSGGAVTPIALAILLGLFLVQSHGTGRVGIYFSPVMAVWFATIAVLGLIHVIRMPGVLWAIDPRYASVLFTTHSGQAFVMLGAVVLAVTGAEAMHADMGHFGRRPIRLAWVAVVLPSLILNYFGQGALLLGDPSALVNPFYHLAPEWARLPLVVLATAATVIASQAVISGAFSLTRQAVRLGYLPRREIRHTSEHEVGQVYIPRTNWSLLCGVTALVLGFGSSRNLAAAYGVTVTGAMVIDTLLAAVLAVGLWRWRPVVAVLVFTAFLAVDVALFGASLLKIPMGGWFPLAMALGVYIVMTTWRRGREVLAERMAEDALPLEMFINRVSPQSPERVTGTAVFMTGNPDAVPPTLLHNLKHNKVLHERVVVLTVSIEDLPRQPPERSVEVQKLGKGFYRATVRFGYLDQPNLPQALERCRSHGLPLEMMDTSFFVGRETLIPSPGIGLPTWREPLFIALSKTALSATEFFSIPSNRVVELGTQIEI